LHGREAPKNLLPWREKAVSAKRYPDRVDSAFVDHQPDLTWLDLGHCAAVASLLSHQKKDTALSMVPLLGILKNGEVEPPGS